MNLKSMALVMAPYWLLGLFMIWATARSKYKEVVRIQTKDVFSWIKFLIFIAIYRIIFVKVFHNIPYVQGMTKNVSLIPWPLAFTVFWEDACHGLPLLLVRKFIGTDKWTWPIHFLLTLTLMAEFGIGHLYQGIIPAILLSLYIPFSVKLGEKYGFGTVMIGHMFYDLSVFLTLKLAFGV